MIPPFAWLIVGVTVALLIGSAVLRKRYRPPPHVAMPPPEPAPWEKEGGTDLTMPAGGLSEIAQPPKGSRVRPWATSASVNDRLLDEVTSGLARVPPFPQALLQMLQELDAAGSSAKSVAEIVSTEPVLTASLLRVANSAAIGLGREIVTVADAVAYLGFSAVKSLLVRLKLGGLFRQTAFGGLYDSQKLWVHSMAVGQAAEELAIRAGHTDPHLALTVGLMHDIGKVAINSQFPDTVRELWKPGGAADESFLARERRLFGADHAFIGGYLASNWKLPEELIEMIRLHHLPAGEPLNLRPEARRALQAIFVANQLVKYWHVYCEDMEIDIIPAALIAELGLPTETSKLLDESMRQTIERAALVSQAAAAPPRGAAA